MVRQGQEQPGRTPAAALTLPLTSCGTSGKGPSKPQGPACRQTGYGSQMPAPEILGALAFWEQIKRTLS